MPFARLLFAIAAVPAALAAQSPVSLASSSARTPNVFHGRLRQTLLTIPKAAASVRIDGRLDDEPWQTAAILTGFSQYSPIDGVPAADSTEVLVMYSDHEVYFGIRAYETHGAVHATHADRDRIGADDNVQLILDTFNDRRRAYTFAVNPLGVQSDGMFADATGTDLSPESPVRIQRPPHRIRLRGRDPDSVQEHSLSADAGAAAGACRSFAECSIRGTSKRGRRSTAAPVVSRAERERSRASPS